MFHSRPIPLPRAALLLVVASMWLAAPVQGGAAADPPVAKTEILWDTWGIPHIFAPDGQSLLFAFGWSQCHNHGDLLLRLYGESRGRAAEYWGPRHLAADQWIHQMGIPRRAAAWLDQIKPEYRAMTEAFVRGVNAYASRYPERIAPEVRIVLPITAADVMGHYQRIIHYTFVAGHDALGRPTEQWHQRGSNAWAIGPSHTADGHAILLSNPHLPWSGLFTWHEAHWILGDVNLSGATLIGFPYLAIACNDYLGWTHTVNTFDGADLYEVTLDNGGYLLDGEVRPIEEERHVLKVRADDGSFTTHELVVQRTAHGPIIARNPRNPGSPRQSKAGKALALRVTGLDAPHVLEQYWRMGAAKNLAEFEAGQSMLQMPIFTTMYADRDGRIMHLFGGRVPDRDGGDWQLWSGIVPGGEGTSLWTATHPYQDLPRVIDPASGWLQNANDPPWTTTFPPTIAAADYPPYFAPPHVGLGVALRAQRSARLLIDTAPATFEDVVHAKHSTRVEMADRLIDDLAAAVAAHREAAAGATDALAVLEQWDRCTDARSRGAVLFLRWVQRVGLNVFAQPWSPEAPLNTPDGLADPAKAVAALAASAADVAKAYGSADVAWGEVHRLRHGELDLPSNGGPGVMGIFRNVEYQPEAGGKFRAIGGDSYITVAEFSRGPGGPRIEGLLPYGNASQPRSLHNGDQFHLFAQKKLRPVWRTRSEVQANLEHAEDLTAVIQRAPGF